MIVTRDVIRREIEAGRMVIDPSSLTCFVCSAGGANARI
jgi:hypothetical protein